jgi:chaperone required for assembly of F1-ATPase
LSAEPVRRFYASATAAEEGGAHIVRLDQRTLKTPSRKPLHMPTRALAAAIAAEWDAQGEVITPATMPLTRYAFAAIDLMPMSRDLIANDLAKYIETDLVSHRAESPAPLVARQAQVWDPIVHWAERRFAMRVPVVAGIIAASTSVQHRVQLQEEIERLDDFRAMALAQAVTLAGSILIGFAFLEGALDANAAFTAAALDDLWSLENWGEDPEARARLDRQRAEWQALQRFITALSAESVG